MRNKLFIYACIALAFCFILGGISYAAENQTAGAKAKTFWQKLFNYPADVTNESAKVVADTTQRGTNVVTREVKTVGQVTSGNVKKTKELVVEPLTGTAETTKSAVEGIIKAPVNAAKQPMAENK
jgi:hypothetical protein